MANYVGVNAHAVVHAFKLWPFHDFCSVVNVVHVTRVYNNNTLRAEISETTA